MKMAHLFSRQLMVMVLLSIGGTAWGDCTLDAINIAKCKSYTLEQAANYPSVDKSTDATDLTDGIFVGAMPTDAGTIGWREYPGVRITTNLNKPGCSESNNSACASISEISVR